MQPMFDLAGQVPPASPVVLSVPHAGRIYPPPLLADARVPMAALVALEDRHVDTVAQAAHGQETMIVQRIARAWIDLNRAEDDRDPRLDDGARTGHLSTKVRSGLGLVPRRTSAAGDLWRRRLRGSEVEGRILATHRPYHLALHDALVAARQRFGIAVLLDVHSMPSLVGSRTRIVIGDRFGRSAAARFVAQVDREVARAGFVHALNAPYAGGHILERHGDPAGGVHAIQLEIDRSLYLDAQLDSPGPGFDRVVALVRAIADALAEEALAAPTDLAAE